MEVESEVKVVANALEAGGAWNHSEEFRVFEEVPSKNELTEGLVVLLLHLDEQRILAPDVDIRHLAVRATERRICDDRNTVLVTEINNSKVLEKRLHLNLIAERLYFTVVQQVHQSSVAEVRNTNVAHQSLAYQCLHVSPDLLDRISVLQMGNDILIDQLAVVVTRWINRGVYGPVQDVQIQILQLQILERFHDSLV